MDDSRLAGHHGTVTHPTLPLERTYCFNCGRQKGWVSTESYNYIKVQGILVICNLCEEKLGTLPLLKADIPEIPL